MIMERSAGCILIWVMQKVKKYTSLEHNEKYYIIYMTVASKLNRTNININNTGRTKT